jgi:hypothetical protein
MTGVPVLARKPLWLSRGTVPSAVPVGQDGGHEANGTLGTDGTRAEAIDADAMKRECVCSILGAAL